MLKYRISHKNINTVTFPTPQDFDTIFFDSNLNCNLHCLYCHNPRDLNLVKEADFETPDGSGEGNDTGYTMGPGDNVNGAL